MKPALTPEEWGRVPEKPFPSKARILDRGRVVTAAYVKGKPTQVELVASGDYAALAALCLHGQPFGFTREMVTLLRIKARHETIHGVYTSAQADPYLPGVLIDMVADRIEALLPPEGA